MFLFVVMLMFIVHDHGHWVHIKQIFTILYPHMARQGYSTVKSCVSNHILRGKMIFNVEMHISLMIRIIGRSPVDNEVRNSRYMR